MKRPQGTLDEDVVPAPPSPPDGRDILRVKKRLASPQSRGVRPDRHRLRESLRVTKRLVSPEGCGCGEANHVDLASALALCCGLSPPEGPRGKQAITLAHEIGGLAQRHIVFVLCDGMGNSILDMHLKPDSFLRRNNQQNRLLSVFPATTPAVLTTLATAAWPGRHGVPGWELRDQKGCEFPGEPGPGPVQLTVLYPFVADMRSKAPASTKGFGIDDVFVEKPWVELGEPEREMAYVNAYNGTGFTNWYQGGKADQIQSIPETAAETLGKPEGSDAAVGYFRRAVDAVLAGIRSAEDAGKKSYTYLYTAHPDKHMHALGIEHEEVRSVMEGLDAEVSRMWEGLAEFDSASLLVTADHGHVTVRPSDMVTLPDRLLECLEYACVGVHGKGRHAVLYCRHGRQQDLEARWADYPELCEGFLLLTPEDAAAEGLFGPEPPRDSVRPRLGDFIAVSLGPKTLVSPKEAARWRDGDLAGCQGAHGSLTPEEMRVPFVLLKKIS